MMYSDKFYAKTFASNEAIYDFREKFENIFEVP